MLCTEQVVLLGQEFYGILPVSYTHLYRVDVQRDCDVVEDILRIYGYNNVEIPTTLKSSLTTKGEVDKSQQLQNLISEQLIGCGFNEILNNSLTCLLYTSRCV